jgi:hypothetical protein
VIFSPRRGGRCAVGAPTGAVSASLRLRCGARGRGRADHLAAFAALSTLRHVRRVRSGCARVRAPTSTPALRAAPQVAPTAHRPPRGTGCSLPAKSHCLREGVAGVRAACVGGGEERRPSGRAWSHALRQLTRGRCLSATNEVSEASSAAGRKTEHRKAVGAKRGPPRSHAARTPTTPLPRADRRTRLPGKGKPITNS